MMKLVNKHNNECVFTDHEGFVKDILEQDEIKRN